MHEKEFQELLKKTKARGTKKAIPVNESLQSEMPAAGQPPTITQLPPWADSVRGIPNAILRSALFGVSNERVIYKSRTLIASTSDCEIRVKGEIFNQTDLDDFAGLLHLGMPHPLGIEVRFSVHSFLKLLGRGTGKSQHEQFKETIARFGSCWIEISYLGIEKTYAGNLLKDAYRDDRTGDYVILLNTNLINLYDKGFYTLLPINKRMALGRNNLAKWLGDFYSTHAKPFSYKVATIREMCRSDTKELFHFRQALKKALEAIKANGVIDSWRIDEMSDLVHVTRIPSGSQQRHLTRTQRTKKP